MSLPPLVYCGDCEFALWPHAAALNITIVNITNKASRRLSWFCFMPWSMPHTLHFAPDLLLRGTVQSLHCRHDFVAVEYDLQYEARPFDCRLTTLVPHCCHLGCDRGLGCHSDCAGHAFRGHASQLASVMVE